MCGDGETDGAGDDYPEWHSCRPLIAPVKLQPLGAVGSNGAHLTQASHPAGGALRNDAGEGRQALYLRARRFMGGGALASERRNSTFPTRPFVSFP